MLARAGLGGVPLGAADWPEGVVGVPGDGQGVGLAAEREVKHRDIAGIKATAQITEMRGMN